MLSTSISTYSTNRYTIMSSLKFLTTFTLMHCVMIIGCKHINKTISIENVIDSQAHVMYQSTGQVLGVEHDYLLYSEVSPHWTLVRNVVAMLLVKCTPPRGSVGLVGPDPGSEVI